MLERFNSSDDDARQSEEAIRRFLLDRSRVCSVDPAGLVYFGIFFIGGLIFLALHKSRRKAQRERRRTELLDEDAWEKEQDQIWRDWEKK